MLDLESIQTGKRLRGGSQDRAEPKAFLPDLKDNDKYTLVLDLDETLVHYDWSNKQFKIRPYTRAFLKEMSQFFELVIFTAAN